LSRPSPSPAAPQLSDAPHALVAQVVEDRLQPAMQHRVHGVGRDLTQRREREGPLVQLQVRHLQLGLGDDVLGEQEVHVHRPRAPARPGHAAQLALDGFANREEVAGREGAVHLEHGVQVLGLGRAHGRTLIERGAAADLHASGARQHPGGQREVLLPVSQIRAQSQPVAPHGSGPFQE